MRVAHGPSLDCIRSISAVEAYALVKLSSYLIVAHMGPPLACRRTKLHDPVSVSAVELPTPPLGKMSGLRYLDLD